MSKRTTILVTRFSGLGDVAISLPVLRQVAAQYPVNITLLTHDIFSPIFEGIPKLQVMSINSYRDMSSLKMLAREVENEIDLVADLHNVLRSRFLSALLSKAGKPVKQLNSFSDNRMIDKYADVFASLGFPIDVEKCTYSEKVLMQDNPLFHHDKKAIGFSPISSQEHKNISAARIKEILSQLHREDTHVYLFGNEKEVLLETLERDFENVTNVAGKTDFKSELALISNMNAFLSLDSGNGHIAANYNVPVITMWEGTTPKNGYIPFKQSKDNSVYSTTGVEEIIQKVWNFL